MNKIGGTKKYIIESKLKEERIQRNKETLKSYTNNYKQLISNLDVEINRTRKDKKQYHNDLGRKKKSLKRNLG